MERRKIVLVVVAAALLVGLYLAGVGLGARTRQVVSVDGWRERLGKARPLEPADVNGRCVSGRELEVGPGPPCELVVGSTGSLRRRALFLEPGIGRLEVEVIPREHRERRLKAKLESGVRNELPIDRSGASVLLTCTNTAGCTATIR